MPLSLACPVNNAIPLGVAYSGTMIAAGGTAPYVLNTIMPLPPGLTLSTTGTITGTPTTPGSWFYTVQVTDAASAKAVVTCMFYIPTGSSTGTNTPTFGNTNTCYFKHWETRYEARNEPAKINYYRSDIQSLEEVIVDAFDVDINPNGTVFGTVYVDNIATLTATITGTNRQSYTYDVPLTSYPLHTYGRTMHVGYTGTAFKMYKTWFHTRPEPDRWIEFISDKQSGDEREIKVFKPEVNCLGNTVLATVWMDRSLLGPEAVSTHTITGTERQQYTFSVPVEKFTRTAWASYRAGTVGTNGTFTAGGVRFKHYTTEFEGPPEPPRVTLFRTGPYPYTSDHYLKTWLPRLDPIAGTVTGSLFVNDTLIQTSTFTGNRQQWFTVGIDLVGTNAFVLQTGSRWEAVYSCSSGQFKHYETKLDSDVDPFRKIYYSFNYRKVGGANQIDLGRYWSIEAIVPDTTNHAPIPGTYWWDIDGENFVTGTLTLAEGNQFYDRIPFPPGARGRLFQFRFYAPYTVKIAHVNVDLMEEGIKNLTRIGQPGTPPEATTYPAYRHYD